MFASLNQGSIIYILDKTDEPKLEIGEVISVSAPRNNFSPTSTSVIDLKVNVKGNVYDYNSIPSACSIVTYNNNRITISETKQGLQSEVESLLANSKQIVDNLDKYKRNIEDCELILKELNPLYAKDKERDDRLDNLESKLDKILTLINK